MYNDGIGIRRSDGFRSDDLSAFGQDIAPASAEPARAMGILAPEIPVRADENDPVFANARDLLRISGAPRDRRSQQVSDVLAGRNFDLARKLATGILSRQPRNVTALSVKAELARRGGDYQEALRLFEKCVEIAPDCPLYRYNYAVLLAVPKTADRALAQLDSLLAADSANPLYRWKKAELLKRIERYAEAAECMKGLAEEFPGSGTIQLTYGHLLRTLGRREECIAALQRAAAHLPTHGGIWWSLASLKMFRFRDDELKVMEQMITRSDLSSSDRIHLHYSLGVAYDEEGEYEKSFSHYTRGNAIRRVSMNYNPDDTTDMVTHAKRVFTPEFFRQREGLGCESDAPIFVLGLQRAGSTLLEQILGTHSKVEPAGELHTILQLVAENVMPRIHDVYPGGLENLNGGDLKEIGERYLDLVGKRRKKPERPHFVDKCPYNLWHVGLIRLVLPNAKIIDARRHPLGCCLANFTVSFQFGPTISYSQTEIARFYADYVRLMAHFDKIMPGKVLRVIYEQVVEDLEGQVRRMLEYIGLPFEPACLEYYKTERAFSSFSNEQVRSPIFREGLDRWKNYEPWLGPMKAALGPVLNSWPDVPQFDA